MNLNHARLPISPPRHIRPLIALEQPRRLITSHRNVNCSLGIPVDALKRLHQSPIFRKARSNTIAGSPGHIDRFHSRAGLSPAHTTLLPENQDD
jgi:hypothetical protein